MSNQENDIDSYIASPEQYQDGNKSLAYQIAEHIMKEFEPGFVIIGSPAMGETSTGHMYPDAIGVVINHKIGLTQSSLSAIMYELASQLHSTIDTVEDFLADEAEKDEPSE